MQNSVSVYIVTDERYYVYTIEEPQYYKNQYPIEVTKDFVTKYNRIFSEFAELQSELERLVKNDNNK